MEELRYSSRLEGESEIAHHQHIFLGSGTDYLRVKLPFITKGGGGRGDTLVKHILNTAQIVGLS